MLNIFFDASAGFNEFYFLGKDVLAKARTGTGKTVAFLVKHYIFVFPHEYILMFESREIFLSADILLLGNEFQLILCFSNAFLPTFDYISTYSPHFLSQRITVLSLLE